MNILRVILDMHAGRSAGPRVHHSLFCTTLTQIITKRQVLVISPAPISMKMCPAIFELLHKERQKGIAKLTKAFL